MSGIEAWRANVIAALYNLNEQRREGGRAYEIMEEGVVQRGNLVGTHLRLMLRSGFMDVYVYDDTSVEAHIYLSAPTPEEVERTPRLVKILRIESYEDALHNLAATAERMARDETAREREEAYRELASEEAYRLRYWICLLYTSPSPRDRG